jgi:hypothetical protein
VTEERFWPARCHDFGLRFTSLSVSGQSKDVQISFLYGEQQLNSGPGRLIIEVS